ncbi:hypothetical protein [Halodesulfovibrio sp.]|uniref:hypothetical protein n=1 Tax=Halodesulfovibrio sp. TaxID=1912772 RepID=UPI0025BAFC08|nr:hypothetical protein [Halodesulfovibrio sp.]
MSNGFKRFLNSLPFASLFSAPQKHEPETQKIGRGAYAITLPLNFKYIGDTSVSVPLHSEVSGTFARATVNSKVYSDTETTLFIQRISAPVSNTYFVPLEGEELSLWGKVWRKNSYSVDTDDTTKEFNSYCKYIAENKLSPRSFFLIEMLDRRISPTSILRIVAFTSGNPAGFPPAPESTSRYSIRKNN